MRRCTNGLVSIRRSCWGDRRDRGIVMGLEDPVAYEADQDEGQAGLRIQAR